MGRGWSSQASHLLCFTLSFRKGKRESQCRVDAIGTARAPCVEFKRQVRRGFAWRALQQVQTAKTYFAPCVGRQDSLYLTELVKWQIVRIARSQFRRMAQNCEALNKTPNRESQINLARFLWCSGNGVNSKDIGHRVKFFRTKHCGPILQRCHQRHGTRCTVT